MIHYSEYLNLDVILRAQHPVSEINGQAAHDETLFIIIHQSYELWFRQILHELDSVRRIMRSPAINDNSPALQTVVHRLSRTVIILKSLVAQIDIMETMTPMDFLEFRDLLRPASGFQSQQFRLIEVKLGLKLSGRHGLDHYLSQLGPEQVALLKAAEEEESILDLVNTWLERMPFDDKEKNWEYYSRTYSEGLSEGESRNRAYFDAVFENGNMEERRFSPAACRAALFILLYRGYPILHLPFELLNHLLEVDEQLSTWRYRHMNMVHRMIGTRTGTGGSSGKEYLKGAADRHYIFAELARLNSFLIERRKLPPLTKETETKLGFVHS